MSYLLEVVPAFLKNTPEITAWLLGIILGVVMVRRGGTRVEKLFLAGCGLMFVVELFSSIVRELATWLISGQDTDNIDGVQIMGQVSFSMAVLGLAGLVCLVWAFWTRFWRKKTEVV